ncbi:hypothetical protein [Pseudomonas aeruginosa]|uniref:hypothetical protein n=1 Tax=Pseudomonas aeruginosa TaxID=287 RepID=UPI000FD73107|nr:hypothetical protein [Pseudomonas aeruginosa]
MQQLQRGTARIKFIKNKQRKDGLHSQCKSCVNEKRKKYRELNYEKSDQSRKNMRNKIMKKSSPEQENGANKIVKNQTEKQDILLNNSERLKEYSKSWEIEESR